MFKLAVGCYVPMKGVTDDPFGCFGGVLSFVRAVCTVSVKLTLYKRTLCCRPFEE